MPQNQATLAQNQFMTFPAENQDDYKGTITFRKVTPSSDTIESVLGSILPTRIGERPTPETAPPEMIDIWDTILNTRDTIDRFFGQDEATRTLFGDSYGVKSFDGVRLFLPEAIQIKDGVNIDNTVELGQIGGALERGIKNGSGVPAAAMKAVSGTLESLADMIRTEISDDAAKLAVARAASKFGDNISNAVSSGLGVAVNPNTRALFKSVPLREFSFQFKLIPQSRVEAALIQAIIAWFRITLYPDTIRGEKSDLHYGYKFPDLVNIEMKYDNKNIPGVKIYDCFMRDFSASYNGTAQGMHDDGNWTEVEITMSFTETRALNKKDMLKEYGFVEETSGE